MYSLDRDLEGVRYVRQQLERDRAAGKLVMVSPGPDQCTISPEDRLD